MSCLYEGCNSEKIRARGYCANHYQKLRLAGEFDIKPRVPYPVIDQFLIDEVAASEFSPSVRNLYYRAVAQGIIPKDADGKRNNYQLIVLRCLALRKEGGLSWDDIVDESRQAHEISHYDNGDQTPAHAVMGNLDFAAYKISPWREKETIAEVWVESRSTAQSIHPLCSELRVDLVPLGGQSSWAFVYSQVQKINARGKPTHVLLISDYDKSGLEIAECAREKIDYFSDEQPITIERIGITEEQIDAYGLPTGTPNAKSLRSAPHITRTCEIEAMAIDDLALLVTDSLAPWITEQDVTEAQEMQWGLHNETEKISNRLREVIEDEFMQDLQQVYKQNLGKK